MESNLSEVNPSGNGNPERRSGNFHPNVWGDFFLAFETLEIFPDKVKQELETSKEEIRTMLRETADQSSLKLDMINNIQRLGISYYFEDEIKTSLLNVYNNLNHYYETMEEENLHTVAVRFRLLREQGHRVSCERLKKFQNKEGEFNEFLKSDVVGMLSLYEASHYRVHGEKILDDALSFTTSTLQNYLAPTTNLSSDLFIANQISHALQWPIRKTLNRVASKLFISLYQQDKSHDKALLSLAKLDFNAAQRMHKRELCDLTKWWKGLDFGVNFCYAREKLVEIYYGLMGVYFEPQYYLGRKFLVKTEYLITIMDDTYDTYGTIDELILFTNATESWNKESINNLPTYIRPLFQAFLDLFNEMEVDLGKTGRSLQVKYVKEKVKELAKSYYQEAYWYHNNYLPRMVEYMDTGRCSITNGMLATISYLGMDNLVAEEVLKWSMSEPLIIRACCSIARIMNDIRANKDQDDDNSATAVKCYMKQYCVSKKVAIEELEKEVTSSWKDLNDECLFPTAVPLVFTDRVVNLTKLMYTMFKELDGFKHSDSVTKNLITYVLVDPVI